MGIGYDCVFSPGVQNECFLFICYLSVQELFIEYRGISESPENIVMSMFNINE